MAGKKKAAVGGLNMALLASILTSTANGGFLYVSDAEAAPFLSHNPPLIEVNETNVPREQGTNKIAARTTDAGKAMVEGSGSNAGAAASAPKEKPKFSFGVVDVPEKKRRSTVGTSIYPFDELVTKSEANPQAGKFNSFFIPATDERPNPAKALASTVSSATRRYAVQEGTKPDPKDNTKTVPNMVAKRKFVIHEVADGAPWGHSGVAGAAVIRSE
jgi:hypothetical protein